MVSTGTRNVLSGKISNFSLDDEVDRQEYEQISEACGSGRYIAGLKSLLEGPPDDVGAYTRAELEQRYRDVVTQLLEARREAAEFRTLLYFLDIKISRVVGWIEDTFAPYVLQPHDLSLAFKMHGFTPWHKLFLRSQEKLAKQGQKPHLRLVK